MSDTTLRQVLSRLANAVKGVNGKVMDRSHTLSELAPLREATPGEAEYFKRHPEVAAMGADDDMVVFNPYVTMSDADRYALRVNESARIAMDRRSYSPVSPLTEGQRTTIAQWGGPYAENDQLARQTVIARILSGDRSLAPYTAEQEREANSVADYRPPLSTSAPLASHRALRDAIKHLARSSKP